jgi:hypothetical protein
VSEERKVGRKNERQGKMKKERKEELKKRRKGRQEKERIIYLFICFFYDVHSNSGHSDQRHGDL